MQTNLRNFPGGPEVKNPEVKNCCLHCMSFSTKGKYFFESSFGKAAIWLHWFITSMDMNLFPQMEISHLPATWEERPPFWMLAFYGTEQVHRDRWWEKNGPYLSVSDRPAECVGWFLRLWRTGIERGRLGERKGRGTAEINTRFLGKI